MGTTPVRIACLLGYVIDIPFLYHTLLCVKCVKKLKFNSKHTEITNINTQNKGRYIFQKQNVLLFCFSKCTCKLSLISQGIRDLKNFQNCIVLGQNYIYTV